MSFDLFPFPALKLPSIWNAIAGASRECHYHLLIYERLVIGLAALRGCKLVWPKSATPHGVSDQWGDNDIHIRQSVNCTSPIFIKLLPCGDQLARTSHQPVSWGPHTLLTEKCHCHVFEWNPDLPTQNKPMAACAQTAEDGIIQGQVILSVLTQ